MKITQKTSTIKSLAKPFFATYMGLIMTVILIAAVIQLVPVLICDVFFSNSDFIMSVVEAYSIIISAPLAFGEAILFLSAFRNQCAGLNSLAYGFQYFNKALILYVSIYFRVILGTIFFIVPGIIMLIKYSLAFYVLADNPNLLPKSCMKESARLMKGNEFALIKLFISFIPLFLVATLPRIALAYIEMELPLVYTEQTIAASIATAWASPICTIVGMLVLLPQAYYEVCLACFYDIAAEKLVFNGQPDVQVQTA